MEKPNANPTDPQDVLPLIKSNLSIPEIAERLDISVEAACALVVASLQRLAVKLVHYASENG